MLETIHHRIAGGGYDFLGSRHQELDLPILRKLEILDLSRCE
jgi:hypothetical protein